jgi:hypothetical protein
VVRRQLVTPADQDVVTATGDLHDVVRHETMPPFYEIEHAFALSDTRATDEQKPDAIHVCERAVQGRPRSECFLHDRLDAAIELRRLEAAPEHRHSLGPGKLQQLGRHLLALGDEDAREVEAEECRE